MTSSIRRPLLLFLLALFVFVGALFWRLAAPAQSVDPVALPSGSEAEVVRLQARVDRFPEAAAPYAELGLAYLQRVRETGDVTYYGLAEQAFDAAWQREPGQFQALLGRGWLALARHDFQQALQWGREAHAQNPYSAPALGIVVDAHVELGQYEEAAVALQKMVDLRPDLASYSRIAYLRELHGDVDGAIEAMRLAVETGAPGAEETLWSQVQLGHLYFNRGDLEQAEALYRQALQFQPDYPYAQAGLGRVAAARGDSAEAIAIYEPLVQRYPLAEFVIALGDLYQLANRVEDAQRQYELVGVIQTLNEQAGMDIDLELALFAADHGLASAETVQKAQTLYERRPSIYAADTLAWTLYQNGQYEAAWTYSQAALRLGTQDALLHYHAGAIAHALGDAETARHHLQQALDINPAFSLRYSAQAESQLQQLIAANK